MEHIQPDSVLPHCKLFPQRRHRQRMAASLCRRGTNKSTRPARRKWNKNTLLKYNKDTELLITADNYRILSYTVSKRFVATKNQVKLLRPVEETATCIESSSSTVNIWSGAHVSNPAYNIYDMSYVAYIPFSMVRSSCTCA